MQPVSDPFEDAALVYIRLVGQVSAEAGTIIEQIQTDFGSHAALRAALLIMNLKMEIQENHWLPNIALYAHLLDDYPEALPMTNHAMTLCLKRLAASMVDESDTPESQSRKHAKKTIPRRDN